MAVQGYRKPEAKVFNIVAEHLAIAAEDAVLIDDRESNVEAAKQAGMQALHMTGVENLTQDLIELGIDV
jgi:HAD superfamily hydrolase (TIGR01509 family)